MDEHHYDIFGLTDQWDTNIDLIQQSGTLLEQEAETEVVLNGMLQHAGIDYFLKGKFSQEIRVPMFKSARESHFHI